MKKTGQASDDLPRTGKILLNVALVVNRDDGDSGLSGNVIGNSDITCVHGSNEGFIISLGKAVAELSGRSDLDKVLSRNIGNEAEVVNLATFKCAVENSLELCINGSGETLHGGSDRHAFTVEAVNRAGLVNVNTNDLCTDFCSCFTSRGEDTAAASKDNLRAGCIPGIHVSGNIGVTIELVAVDILDFNIGEAVLSSSCISALNKAIAVTDNCRNCHAAEVAELGVAELHSCITSHVAAELFLIDSAIEICGNISCEIADVAFGNVKCDEGDVIILRNNVLNSFAKGIAGHDENGVTVINGLLHGGAAVFIGVRCGLVVLESEAVCIGKCLAGFIGGLVEGLVSNVTVVGDHLNPSETKLRAKGVTSVRSRVVNLKELSDEITVEGMKQEIIKAYGEEYGTPVSYEPGKKEVDKISEIYLEQSSWEWNYGHTPVFEKEFSDRLSFGEVQIFLNVKDGFITKVKVYSDSLDTSIPLCVEKILLGVRFDYNEIKNRLFESENGVIKETAELFSNV